MNALAERAEKPVVTLIELMLGYSKAFTPNDDTGAVEKCVGVFTELTFHIKRIGDCVEVNIIGNNKGALQPIHFEFCGPLGSGHRFPNGSFLVIREIRTTRVTLEFAAL